ncbi:EF-hand domain-containing protein [bacterium]|nr:EF-hand domain-containing protein [bacterium]
MKLFLMMVMVISLFCTGLYSYNPGFTVSNTGEQKEISQERLDALRQRIDQNTELKTRLIEKFDADSDGALSDSELSGLLSRRKSGGKKGKKSGESGNASGNRAGFKVSREKMMGKFDTDGDGVMSDTEKEAAKAERMAQRKEKMQDRMTSDPEFKEKMLTKFDTDGSGVISDEEMNSQMLNRLKKSEPGNRGQKRKDNLSKYDIDGDGVLNEAERAAMQADRQTDIQSRIDSNPEMKERIMKKFDTDGDGILSDSEKEAIKERRKNRKGRGGGRRRNSGM